MRSRSYDTASNIYSAIVSNQTLREYTVVITGRYGPTGKTTLCKLLVNAGINAIEISETLNNRVIYLYKNDNDVLIDDDNKIVLVVLNRIRSNIE